MTDAIRPAAAGTAAPPAPAPASFPRGDRRISLHGVIVSAGEAFFDDAGPQQNGTFQAIDPAAPGRWHLAWVAVRHDEDGARAYAGLVVEALSLDAAGRLTPADAPGRPLRREAAARGTVEVAPLDADERRLLAAALLRMDPDAWDRATPALRAAFAR
jgi:hypothetical protein